MLQTKSGRETGHIPPSELEFQTAILKHKGFCSRHLSRERDVWICLPPCYSESAERRYPVLYLQDGQNLFDGATSYVPGRYWRVGETALELHLGRKIEPLIIVGIDHAGIERVDEYTPTRSVKMKIGGRADLYGRMLVEELKPFIDARYRTKREAESTGIGGSSLGGLVSLHLGLRHPEVFGKLAVLSPSVWWDDSSILREVDAFAATIGARIWLDAGTAEGAATLRGARLLRDRLVSKGCRSGEGFNYEEFEGAGHDEEAWAARVAPFLKFLFPPS